MEERNLRVQMVWMAVAQAVEEPVLMLPEVTEDPVW
jgi:hypothetical protein